MKDSYIKGDIAVDDDINVTYEIIDIYRNANGGLSYLFKNVKEYYEMPFEVQDYRMKEYKVRRHSRPRPANPPRQINKDISLTVDLDSTEAYSKLDKIEQKLLSIKKLHDEVFNG